MLHSSVYTNHEIPWSILSNGDDVKVLCEMHMSLALVEKISKVTTGNGYSF